MIKHDEQWLLKYAENEKLKISTHKHAHVPILESVVSCKKYHEHMNRWRPLTEDPEQDQRIEIAHIAEFGDRLDSTITVYGSIHYEMLMLELGERSLVWRPAPLPSDEEIQALMDVIQ